jgi:hypothetical protein
MYKPNGEEPMTRQEEIGRKAALAERKNDRAGDPAVTSEALRTAFYAALFRSSAYRSDPVESLEITR